MNLDCTVMSDQPRKSLPWLDLEKSITKALIDAEPAWMETIVGRFDRQQAVFKGLLGTAELDVQLDWSEALSSQLLEKLAAYRHEVADEVSEETDAP